MTPRYTYMLRTDPKSPWRPAPMMDTPEQAREQGEIALASTQEKHRHAELAMAVVEKNDLGVLVCRFLT